MTTDVSVTFYNSGTTDPGLAYLRYFGPAPIWINKTTTGVWDLYVQKTESYDNISVLDYKQGSYSQERVSISFPGEFAGSLPSGAVEGTRMNDDFIVEQGTSGVWTYRKWNSGFAECWGYHTISGVNISTAWGGWYASPAIVFPSFPFTFVGAPDVHISWESDFSAIVDGVGKRESTKAGQTYLYRPLAQTGVNGRFAIYSYGKWK